MGALSKGRIAVQVVILALLGACAGGGGGGGGGGSVVSPPASPPPPPPPGTPRPPPIALPPLPPAAAPGTYPAASSQEFQNNWGLEGINARAAWHVQNGHGEGIVIGVIDDGIDPNHPELVGRVSPQSIDIVAGRNALTTTQSHGSELASLMAGNFNGSQTVGVAYEATILAVRADDGTGSFFNSDLAAALNYAVANGVDVVNFSLGSSNPTGQVMRDAMRAATAAGVILVFSAGNSGPGATSPNYPAQLAADSTISNGLILVAGGSNPDGSFNNRSNGAGIAANQYLVAPGWEIIVPDHGPPGIVPGFQQCYPDPNNCTGLVEIQGTSYASPHVAAAAAVLMSAFPGLTPQQVVQIILQSTDDMGAPGIDQLTGWGHLNLERAFGPSGTLSSPLAFANGAEVSASQTLGVAGPAFGDGIARHTAAWTVATFDDFGRTYNANFGDNWISQAAGPPTVVQAPSLWRAERIGATRVEMAFAEDVAPDSFRTAIDRNELQQAATRIEANIGGGLSVSFAAHGASAVERETSEAVGHLAFVNADTSLQLRHRLNDALSFSIISESGETSQILGAPLERSGAAGRASLDLGIVGFDVTAGRLDEQAGVLGFGWTNDIGPMPGGETEFVGLSGHFAPAPAWRLSFDAEWGVANLSRAGWLSVDKPLQTSAFAIEASRRLTPAWLADRGAGEFSLSLAQPLRIEDGEMSFAAPVATNYGRRSLSFERRAFTPTPSGREVRAALGYRYFEGDNLSAFSEIVYVNEPGHVFDADDEGIVRFGLRVRN